MSNFKYDWAVLGKELVKLYEEDKDNKGISKFANKYGMSYYTALYRLKKLGVKIKNRGFQGGKHINNGYVEIYVGNGKYVPEHRLVMEKKLGRKLLRNETPHHIDESFKGRSNNDPSNLQLMTRSDHTKHHMKGKGYNIYFHKQRNKYHLRIQNSSTGKYYSFGLYDTKEDALKAFESGVKIDGRLKHVTC